MAGVGLALIGTVFLVAQKWTSPNADSAWIIITLAGPILLAIGNLYRTLRWPAGTRAESLAPGMLLSALTMLIIFSLLPGWTLSIPTESANAMALIGIQSITFAGQFLLLFVLQKIGGAVLLSLMGGVSALFGVPIAAILLNEVIAPLFFVSALFVGAGIVCMLYGSRTVCERNEFASEKEIK
jgi:drug/metabolite transporter (DMT)-like permease